MRFQQIIARLMNQVRVNSIRPEIRDGTLVFVKKRRLGGSLMVWCGNRFLSLAKSGIHMFVQCREWIAWELHCAQLLYPDRASTIVEHGRTLVMPEVRGVSLREMLRAGKLDSKVANAAAKEIRRAHQIHCSIYGGAWSHGDLHLDNILYHAEQNQATLIDFDTRHDPGLSKIERHADDLKVVLLEFVSTSATPWKEAVTCFLQEYRNGEVLMELNQHLIVPRGFARIFWYTRTANCPLRRIEPRLQSLREIIHQVADIARTAPHS